MKLKMNVKDVIKTGGAGAFTPIVKAGMDWYEGQKSDAKAKSDARDAAARAESEAVAARYDAERAVARNPMERILGTTVPGVTAAALDPRFRDAQLQLMDQLTRQSQGQGPSLAQMQFQQAGNTALQKAMGAIRAATGTNAALGGRTAALASTNLLGNLAAESGMARLKEQQDAQKVLSELATAGRLGDYQTRQQDINLGATNAEIALKTLATQVNAAGGLLDDTGRRFEGNYNRGAQVAASKQGGKSGGDGLMPTVLSTAGAIIASKYGSPAAAPAGAAAGKAAGEQLEGGLGLTGRPAAVKDYGVPTDTRKSNQLKTGPFMKMKR